MAIKRDKEIRTYDFSSSSVYYSARDHPSGAFEIQRNSSSASMIAVQPEGMNVQH
jgi:hypothetical protein